MEKESNTAQPSDIAPDLNLTPSSAVATDPKNLSQISGKNIAKKKKVRKYGMTEEQREQYE